MRVWLIAVPILMLGATGSEDAHLLERAASRAQRHEDAPTTRCLPLHAVANGMFIAIDSVHRALPMIDFTSHVSCARMCSQP
jgi:hypothetical protein